MLNTKSVTQYLLILLILSILTVAIIFIATAAKPKAIVGIYGYILLPAVAALIMRSISGEGLKGARLKLGSLKNFMLAWTIGVGGSFLTFFMLIFLKLGKFDSTYSKFGELLTSVGTTIPENIPQFFVFMSIMSLTIFLIPGTLLAFGEEFGFRGYLLPKLLECGKYRALLLSGLFWGIWRIPLYSLGGGINASNLAFLILTAVLLGVILAWLYFRSKSIWVPCLASAAYQNSHAIYSLIIDIKPWLSQLSGVIVLALICVILYFSREFDKIHIA